MNLNDCHFCAQCQNLTHIAIDTDKKLIHLCKACDNIEPFESTNRCIYSSRTKVFDNSSIINSNEYITYDITLPKIDGNVNIKCPNSECPSLTEQSSVSYIKYDSENMKYLYICNTCGQKWKNS